MSSETIWQLGVLCWLIALLLGAISFLVENGDLDLSVACAGLVGLGGMWVWRREATEEALSTIAFGIIAFITGGVWFRNRK